MHHLTLVENQINKLLKIMYSNKNEINIKCKIKRRTSLSVVMFVRRRLPPSVVVH